MSALSILSGPVSDIDKTGLTHPDGRNIVTFRVGNKPVYFHHRVDLHDGERVTLVATPKHDRTKVLALRNENTKTEYIADVRFRALLALAVFLVGVLTLEYWVGIAFMGWAVALLIRARLYKDAISLLDTTRAVPPQKTEPKKEPASAEPPRPAPGMAVSDYADIHVMRHFTVPAERVFDAWLNPASAGLWLFATPTGKMVQVEMETEIGGKYTITELRDGVRATHTGTYLEIDRPRRLVFTLLVPPHATEPSRVAVDIAAAGEGCVLTLTHENVERQYAALTESGWTGILERLAAMLNAQAPLEISSLLAGRRAITTHDPKTARS